MVERRSEKGIAILEAGIWLTMLLPIALIGVSVATTVHDQNVMQVIPDAVLREARVTPLRWSPNGYGGRYDPDLAELRNVVGTLSRAALLEARRDVFKAQKLSARACFWIYSVNTSTGKLESPISTECDVRGPLGTELSVGTDIAKELSNSLGIPRDQTGSTARFVDRVVVAGVVVGGELPSLLDATSFQRVSFGSVSFPRQEITL